MSTLEELVNEADLLVDRLVEERRQKCQKEGKEFLPIYVTENKENTAKCIRVPDVVNPYTV